ncbi:DUF1840 domain-containing protein [Burkholderiaceae bacterium UC74_6]
MLYKFRSKAGGDVIMLAANGDQVLRLLGREPCAQGIVAKDQMAGAIAALEKAVSDDEAAFERSVQDARAAGEAAPKRSGPQLRQRAWPLIELMRHAQRENEDVIWGA